MIALDGSALERLTVSAAVGIASSGIIRDLIARGTIDTDVIAALRARPGFDEASRADAIGSIRRRDDVTGAALMPCLPEAGRVTGTVIQAAGGSARRWH